MKISCIIPARMQSKRFPGKPLAPIDGVPMIVRTYNQVKDFNWHSIHVATDNIDISNLCYNYDIPTILTSKEHHTGTDRVAEAAEQIDSDFFVNIQGDEPIIPKSNVSYILDKVRSLNSDPESSFTHVINAYTQIETESYDFIKYSSKNVIKVVTNKYQELVYMSRSVIPSKENCKLYKQVCIYAFSKVALEEFAKHGPTDLENNESIEILRFLDIGYKPKMFEVEPGSIAVDVPEDVLKVEEYLESIKNESD